MRLYSVCFKQKTAYEMLRSLVGSEMCIRDRYNMGGSRFSHCSMQEAVQLCEEITGRNMKTTYVETNRIGDHIWWISDTRKFKSHYPDWRQRYDLKAILVEIYNDLLRRDRRPS